MDENLNWNWHSEELLKKLSSACFALKTIKKLTNLKTAKLSYYANFESHLRYGIEIWGGTSASNLTRLFKLQKRAIRIIIGLEKKRQSDNSYSKPHCKPHFIKHSILTLYSLYIFHSSINTHLNLSNKELNSNILTHS